MGTSLIRDSAEEPSIAAASSSVGIPTLTTILVSQYRAALLTLKECVEKCPESLWDRELDTNKSWQHAYHALYFAHVYTTKGEHDFTPWSGQHAPSVNDDAIGWPPAPDATLPWLPDAYTKAEVLEYWDFIWNRLDAALASIDLTSENCGFVWYSVSKLEHQLVNIRHIQHHAAQMIERLRTEAGIAIRWYGKG